MEIPVLLAEDTTENWNKGNALLGSSELAIDIAGKNADGSPKKRLLVGDGKQVAPNVQRLRATSELIEGLPEEMQGLAGGISKETNRALAAEEQLQTNIAQSEEQLQKNITAAEKQLQTNITLAERRLQGNIESRATYTDDTLTGKGTPAEPLSVNIKYDLTVAGIVAAEKLDVDGKQTEYPLPDDFVFVRIVLVEINGLGQKNGTDYALNLDARTITFNEAPEADDSVTIFYTSN